MGGGLVFIPALWVCFWNRSHAESPASLLGTLQSMQKIKQIPPPNLSQTTVRKIPDVALAYSVAFCGGRRAHNPLRSDSPREAPSEQNAFCSSPQGCRKAEKCGDSRSRTFRPGGNAGVRRKGQRVRESSTERTHNDRRYATLPGGGADVVRPDIPARPRAAWRCGLRTINDAGFIHKPHNAQRHTCRAQAVSGHVFGDALC